MGWELDDVEKPFMNQFQAPVLPVWQGVKP